KKLPLTAHESFLFSYPFRTNDVLRHWQSFSASVRLRTDCDGLEGIGQAGKERHASSRWNEFPDGSAVRSRQISSTGKEWQQYDGGPKHDYHRENDPTKLALAAIIMFSLAIFDTKALSVSFSENCYENLRSTDGNNKR
ncbi:hypothetical protein RvY_03681-4, partial [Ramazzottius varieornatus]